MPNVRVYAIVLFPPNWLYMNNCLYFFLQLFNHFKKFVHTYLDFKRITAGIIGALLDIQLATKYRLKHSRVSRPLYTCVRLPIMSDRIGLLA